MTTAFAFAPIALMEGPAGEFVGSIAVTVMLAIFSSLLLSVTVLPAMAALWQSDQVVTDANEANQGFWYQLCRHGITLPRVKQIYRRLLTNMLLRPWWGIVAGCVLPLLGFVAATQLSEQFFPPTDRDQFHIELELPPQAALAQTEHAVRQIDALLKAHPRVRHTTWFLGDSAPPFYYNLITRRKSNPQYAQAIVTLDSNRRSLEMIRRLQRELDEAIPAARVLVRQLEQGPPFEAPLEIRLFGPDLDILKDYGEQLRLLATRVPKVVHVRSTLNDTRPVARVAVDARQAYWVGLSESDLADQLFSRLEGLPAGSIIEQVEQVPVRVRIAESHRANLEEAAQFAIAVVRNTRQLAGTCDQYNASSQSGDDSSRIATGYNRSSQRSTSEQRSGICGCRNVTFQGAR